MCDMQIYTEEVLNPLESTTIRCGVEKRNIYSWVTNPEDTFLVKNLCYRREHFSFPLIPVSRLSWHWPWGIVYNVCKGEWVREKPQKHLEKATRQWAPNKPDRWFSRISCRLALATMTKIYSPLARSSTFFFVLFLAHSLSLASCCKKK